jgi:hypothetical protein
MSARFYSAKKIIDNLNKAVTSYPGFVDTQLSHIADLIEDEAYRNARKRTGRMAAMTTKKKFKKGDAIGYEVSGTAEYTIYVHAKYPYIQEAFEKYAPMVTRIDFKKLFSGGSNFSSGW